MEQDATISQICIDTFARIAASISHEIKNTLSIINENAGLLEDLAIMAGDDGGVSGERIKGATSSIARQVERSNVIMKNLNRFAHSGDVPIAWVNLEEVLGLVLSLSSRQAAMKQVSVTHTCPAATECRTKPMVFEVLLFDLLCRVYATAEDKGALLVEGGEHQSTIIITIRPADQHASWSLPAPDNRLLPLITHLGGSFTQKQDSLSLILPKDIMSDPAA
jgi:signal transduction histidine kinase